MCFPFIIESLMVFFFLFLFENDLNEISPYHDIFMGLCFNFFFICSKLQDEYTLYISCFKVISLNYDSKKNGGHIITLVTKNKKHVDGLRYSVWVNSIEI